MYEIEIQRVFHASHAIRLYDGAMEEPHAHDWHVFAYIAAQELDAIEVVMDFHELERIVDAVLKPFHGADINTLPAFATLNPSAERIVEVIYRGIAPRLPDRVKLTKVTITEAPGCRASFWL